MKILFLVHSFPYPPDDGMRSTSYRLIKHIARNHETALLSLIESEREREHIPEMLKWCKKVEVVLHVPPRSLLQRGLNILFDKEPFCVTQFYSAPFVDKLKILLRNESYDVVHFLSVNISGHQNSIGKTPSLFFPHDSVSMQFYRNIEKENNPLRKYYMFTQYKKMKNYEKKMIPKFSRTVLVTNVDRDWVVHFCPDQPITVIPAGVDPDEFKPQDIEDKAPSVIFRGVMNFPPNFDAALYFHTEIMPLVLKEVPNLRFTIVGKNPVASILKLHDGTHTVVTGRVEDIRPYMAKATINICPMRSGSGIKNKILEALAMEKAVVATSLACDGIEVEDRKHLVVADSAGSFAKGVVDLLKNQKLRKSLGQKGRELVTQKYSWSSVALRYGDLYRQILS